MAEEQRTRGESAASSVKAAQKRKGGVRDIAQGAATGGAHGAPSRLLSTLKNGSGVLAGLLLLPVLLVVMLLPVVIFGSLF